MQLRDAFSQISGFDVARLPSAADQQTCSHRDHHHGRTGTRDTRQTAPHHIELRLHSACLAERSGLQPGVGQQYGQEHFIGEDHQRHTQTRGDAQFAHDIDFDVHDHHETQGVGNQRNRTWYGQAQKCITRGNSRFGALHHLVLPHVGHLHRVGNTNGENQKRHQDRHGIDAKSDQGQYPQQPDDRHQRTGQRQ